MTSTVSLDLAALSPDFVAGSAGEAMGARLDAIRQALQGVAGALVPVGSHELAALAGHAAGVVAAAEAARAAIVLEAHQRGVIAGSDHPRVDRWVEQSCREGGAPVTRGQARQLKEVTQECAGPDLQPLREAVLAAGVSLEMAACLAATYRRLRAKIDLDCWDVMLAEMIAWAREGALRVTCTPSKRRCSGGTAYPGRWTTSTNSPTGAGS